MLHLEKCVYAHSIPLDKDGNLNDSENGKYGYRVFYTVPLRELVVNLFAVVKNTIGGELEFSVDGSGKQVGEVLLWTSVEDGDGISNDEFVPYCEDISDFVNDFNARGNLINRDILLSQMDGRYTEKKDVVSDSLAEGFMQMEHLIKEQTVVQGNGFLEKERIVNLLRCHDDFSVESAQKNYEIIKAIRVILGIDERP